MTPSEEWRQQSSGGDYSRLIEGSGSCIFGGGRAVCNVGWNSCELLLVLAIPDGGRSAVVVTPEERIDIWSSGDTTPPTVPSAAADGVVAGERRRTIAPSTRNLRCSIVSRGLSSKPNFRRYARVAWLKCPMDATSWKDPPPAVRAVREGEEAAAAAEGMPTRKIAGSIGTSDVEVAAAASPTVVPRLDGSSGCRRDPWNFSTPRGEEC